MEAKAALCENKPPSASAAGKAWASGGHRLAPGLALKQGSLSLTRTSLSLSKQPDDTTVVDVLGPWAHVARGGAVSWGTAHRKDVLEMKETQPGGQHRLGSPGSGGPRDENQTKSAALYGR